MKKASQLSFDLSRPPAHSAADFLPAPCNEAAIGWIERWPDWPIFALALAGPPASGKSHLAQIFVEKSGAVVVPADVLTTDNIPDIAGDHGVVVEDSDRGVDEAALFHLYNLQKEQGRPLLLTGREPPNRWTVSLPDLRSRLATLPVAEIGSPDDFLLEALLVKLFADRQLRIGPDVIAYALPRIDRSFAAIHDLVDRLDQAALEGGRAVTVPLVRGVLEGA
jgi:chromosomal replication initiation ATPase DnaA